MARGGDELTCATCPHSYPIVLGIPDLRVFPDPWISFEGDREKARRLAEQSRGLSLEETVRAYWAMTPGTPSHQAERFVRYVVSAPPRAHDWLAQVDATEGQSPGPSLEIGAGTGDLVVAGAERGETIVGADIALRWLVVAARRAQLAGVTPQLVCCNGEHLPFADGTFQRVLTVGTLEHCSSASDAVRESRRVLRPRGVLRARTVNRYSITREPHVGIWGVGFLPRRWADAYVKLWGGEGYQHHHPLSPREIRRAMGRAGFSRVRVTPSALLTSDRERLGVLRFAAPTYERLRQARWASDTLAWVAPLLDARGEAA
ncbi:MAG TPA: class I SAM-dependent methyltransferase [Gemmatimonadaceae bacterium]|nr:class I SAM-dependent methyltransferase [Gemmatimonadaceae bacterium]